MGEEYLSGIYLHGSLSMGSYYFPKSDIDIIATAKKPLDIETKRALAKQLLMHSRERPILGDIEFSLVLAEHTKNFFHPLAYELHCGDDLWKSIADDTLDYNKSSTDSDLAAHCMVIKKRGTVLHGPDISKEFGEISWQDFSASVLDDFDWILGGMNILESPFYCVLNGCRVMQMLKCKDQKILSKDEGAIWALENLPKEYHPIILSAQRAYRSANKVPENLKKTAGLEWDQKALLAFRDYLKRKHR